LFPLIIHQAIYTLWNLIYFVIYKIESPFFEQFKTNSEPWPWNSDKKEWMKLLKSTVCILFINQFIIMPIISAISNLWKAPLMRADYESLPSPLEIIKQHLIFYVCTDLVTFIIHYFLHLKCLYPLIHKVHHDHKITISIASEYAHPIEFIFANLLSTSVGPMLLGSRVHMLTYGMWIVTRIINTTEGHSGYDIPFFFNGWSFLPGGANRSFHHFHHLKFRGNYGSELTIWDRIFGTVHPKYTEELNQKELNEHKNEKMH